MKNQQTRKKTSSNNSKNSIAAYIDAELKRYFDIYVGVYECVEKLFKTNAAVSYAHSHTGIQAHTHTYVTYVRTSISNDLFIQLLKRIRNESGHENIMTS